MDDEGSKNLRNINNYLPVDMPEICLSQQRCKAPISPKAVLLSSLEAVHLSCPAVALDHAAAPYLGSNCTLKRHDDL